jgi:hypothetical protein
MRRRPSAASRPATKRPRAAAPAAPAAPHLRVEVGHRARDVEGGVQHHEEVQLPAAAPAAAAAAAAADASAGAEHPEVQRVPQAAQIAKLLDQPQLPAVHVRARPHLRRRVGGRGRGAVGRRAIGCRAVGRRAVGRGGAAAGGGLDVADAVGEGLGVGRGVVEGRGLSDCGCRGGLRVGAKRVTWSRRAAASAERGWPPPSSHLHDVGVAQAGGDGGLHDGHLLAPLLVAQPRGQDHDLNGHQGALPEASVDWGAFEGRGGRRRERGRKGAVSIGTAWLREGGSDYTAQLPSCPSTRQDRRSSPPSATHLCRTTPPPG